MNIMALQWRVSHVAYRPKAIMQKQQQRRRRQHNDTLLQTQRVNFGVQVHVFNLCVILHLFIIIFLSESVRLSGHLLGMRTPDHGH